jgi:hypothetical protein
LKKQQTQPLPPPAAQQILLKDSLKETPTEKKRMKVIKPNQIFI